MKFVALFCVVVLAVEARPQAETQPQQPVVDVVAEFEKFHQLWLAEAQRNSVAPVSPFQTASNAAPTETAAETPAEPEPQPQAEVRAAEPVQQQEPEVVVVQEVQQEVQLKPVEVATQAPDMNTAFANFHALWKAEAARNAIAPSAGPAKETEPAAVQPVAEVKQAAAAIPETPVAEVELAAAAVPETLVAVPETLVAEPLVVAPAEPTVVAPVDHQAEFDAFHKLWQQEAARNAIAPGFQAQPVAAVQTVVTPEVASPAPAQLAVAAAPTPSVAPTANLFSNLGGAAAVQPLIVVLPNWSQAFV